MRDFAARGGAERLKAIAVLGSLAVHGGLIGVLLLAARSSPRPVVLPAYRVELVAAPREAGSAEPTPAPSPAPAPAPAPVPPSAPRVSRPQPAPPAPRPNPAPAPPTAPPSRPSPGPPAPPTAPPGPTAAPGATPGTGSDPASIRTEGVEFPFPGYLRNLVAQVYRRWRPPAGNQNLEAEVLFLVHRDGSISGLQFVRRSGSFAFDLEAQGAVESAARAQAFGALPEGYGPDVLPVSFFFSPRALR